MYYVIPRIFDCQIYSRKLANVQYSLYVIGFIFFFGGFLLTGLVQGTAWLHQGLPVWSVLPGLSPYMAMRASGGGLLVISFAIFSFNVFATVLQRKPMHHPAALLQASVSQVPAKDER
jgi:cbb3-type cytochrome oxidase subunit 1